MSQLLGLSAESLKEKPELLRVGMTQLLRTMLSISKDALDTVDAKSEDAKRRFAATFKEIQEKLGGEGSDLGRSLQNSLPNMPIFPARALIRRSK